MTDLRPAFAADLYRGAGEDVTTFGADRSGIVDCTTALRGARAKALARNVPMVFPPGVYTVSGRIHDSAASANPVNMVAAVPGTVTIQRTANLPIIDIAGTRGTAVALSANATAGSPTLTTATTPGLTAEDQVAIRSNAQLTTAGVAKLAEVGRVKTVTGTGPYTITLYEPLEESYLTADTAVIEKLNLAGADSRLEGILFRQTAVNRDTGPNPLVRFTLATELDITNCRFEDADAPGIELNHCVAPWFIFQPRFRNLVDDLANNRIGYGINLHGNCRGGLVTNPYGEWCRHVVTTNGDSFGAPRHWKVIGGDSRNMSSGAWNTHKESKFGTFAFCDGEFYIRAPYTTLIEPRCSSRPANSIVRFAESECDNGRIIGGVLNGSGGTEWPLDISGRNIQVIGTLVENSVSGKPNINNGGLETKLINIHSRNPGTSYHIQYGASLGTDHIIDGGWWQSTGTAALVNIGSGTTVRAMNVQGSNLNSNGATGGMAGILNLQGFKDQRDLGRLTKTGAYTITHADPSLIALTTISAPYTITLPAASTIPAGVAWTIKDEAGNAATNNVTLSRGGTDTIDGATTVVLSANYAKVTVYSNGVDKWFTV